jgi:hypothetical protein
MQEFPGDLTNSTEIKEAGREHIPTVMVHGAHNTDKRKARRIFSMDWKKYFDFLIDCKKLPAYRLEPRIDSFIGYYLSDIIGHYKKTKVIGIIPEFPIRKKSIGHKDLGERSYKVDFLLITKKGPNFLVEVKSDSKYRRPDQDKYLRDAKKHGLGKLINGINPIYNKTKERPKYKHLIDKLKSKKLSLLDNDYKFIGKNEKIEIIYVQPSKSLNDKDNIIDFKEISEWLNKKQDIDTFEKELSNALLEIHKEDLKNHD